MTFGDNDNNQNEKNTYGGKRAGSGRKRNEIKQVTIGFKIDEETKIKLAKKYGKELQEILRKYVKGLLTNE